MSRLRLRHNRSLVPFVSPTAPATFSTARPTFSGTTWHCATAGDLTTALVGCVDGDIIALAPGVNFDGQFTLRNRGTAGVVEIRTNISTSTLNAICPEGTIGIPVAAARMTPAKATTLNLATIRATLSNGGIVSEWGARGYRLTALRVAVAPGQNTQTGAIVRFGRLDMWQASQVCSDMLMDRCVVSGSTSTSKNFLRGVSCTGPRQGVIDSWVEDFYTSWTTGTDAQPVAVFAYSGPYIIRNNYLDGLSEGFICGGQQWGHGGAGGTVACTGGAATFSVSQSGFVVNGQGMLINRHRYVVSAFNGTTSCTLTSTDGGTLTFGAIGFSIADPADANAVPSDLTFIYNYCTRKSAYIARIAGVGTITCTAGAAVLTQPNTVLVSNNIVVAGVPHYVTAVTDSTHVTLAPDPNTGPVTFGASAFTIQPTAQGKNGFELKSVRRALVAYNIIENVASQAQYGYAMNIKSIADYGFSEDGTTDVEITGNLCRSASGGLQFTAVADDDPLELCRSTSRVWCHDNLIEHVNDTAPFVENQDDPNTGGKVLELIGDLSHLTVEHNTWVKVTNTGAPGISLDAQDFAVTPPHVDAFAVGPLTIRNNIFPHGFYGMFGAGLAEGVLPWNRYANGFGHWDKNVMTGVASVSNQPAGTYAALTEAAVGFTDLAGGGLGYALAGGSPYKGLGTDGADIGIRDIPAFFANLANVAP